MYPHRAYRGSCGSRGCPDCDAAGSWGLREFEHAVLDGLTREDLASAFPGCEDEIEFLEEEAADGQLVLLDVPVPADFRRPSEGLLGELDEMARDAADVPMAVAS